MGDEGQVFEAQKQLGELVGAAVVETVVGGVITVKIAGKAVQIITNRKKPNDQGDGDDREDREDREDDDREAHDVVDDHQNKLSVVRTFGTLVR